MASNEIQILDISAFIGHMFLVNGQPMPLTSVNHAEETCTFLKNPNTQDYITIPFPEWAKNSSISHEVRIKINEWYSWCKARAGE